MNFETPPTSSIALEVGYTGCSHFARVFRCIVDVTLPEFPHVQNLLQQDRDRLSTIPREAPQLMPYSHRVAEAV
jgi:hypothetical protein